MLLPLVPRQLADLCAVELTVPLREGGREVDVLTGELIEDQRGLHGTVGRRR